MGVRETRRRRQREAVLEAALGLIEAEGLEAVTLQAIAERMGASVGGLYRYYPSKGAILVALQKDAIESFHAGLEAALAAAERILEPGDGPGVAALVRVVVALSYYLEHAQSAPGVHRLIDAFLSAPAPVLTDDEAREARAGLGAVLLRTARLLDDAARCGAMAPGDALARTHVAWAALHGLDHFRKMDRLQPERLRTGALLYDTLRALLIGWGAAPASVDAALAPRPT